MPVKGIEVLILAFEQLVFDFPDWKLMIVGDDTTEYGRELKKTFLGAETLKFRTFYGKCFRAGKN